VSFIQEEDANNKTNNLKAASYENKSLNVDRIQPIEDTDKESQTFLYWLYVRNRRAEIEAMENVSAAMNSAAGHQRIKNFLYHVECRCIENGYRIFWNTDTNNNEPLSLYKSYCEYKRAGEEYARSHYKYSYYKHVSGVDDNGRKYYYWVLMTTGG
jgi:hypothetical protein